MDVTSLLNTTRQPSYSGSSIEGSSSHFGHGRVGSAPNVLPNPCIEYARFWHGRETAESRIDELGPFSRRTGLPVSPKDAHKSIFETNGRSRQPSTESIFAVISPPSMRLARHSLPLDNTRVSSARLPHRDQHASYSGESSTIPKYKISIGSSNFTSPASPPSEEYHSRLSSVASVSGISSMSIPMAEIPSIDAKLLEARNIAPGYVLTSQPPSPPLTEKNLAAGQSRSTRIKQFLDSSSTAILNWNNLDKPSLFGQNLRSELITRPQYHRRATSAPIPACRFTTSAPNALKRRHPMPSSTRPEMGEAVPTQAEAPPRPAMPSSYPKLDADRHVLGHQAAKNGHTMEAVNRLHACEADVQCQNQVSDPASDIALLAQQDRGMGGEIQLDAPVEEEPRCMFVDDCQTGSQLRKAISHLFGRNKSCTLRIPKHVWVYYCRKHYQRIRYRNAKTYPLNQMHLVKMQITRLQEWSETNRRQGSGPYIRLWTLTLRKREQNRLDKEIGPADEGDDDAALEAQTGSAAPEWVIRRLGTGYTTEQMLEVAEHLYQEIKDEVLTRVPEIEFLPDIVEADGGGTARLIRTRKHIRPVAGVTQSRASSSKRKISDMADAVTQSRFTPFNQHEAGDFESPMRKRIRVGPPQAYERKHSLPMPPLPSIVMPSADSQYAVPRTLPAIPRMQALSPDHAYGSDAYMHGLPSSRPGPSNGFYGHDSQQYAVHYQTGARSAQPPLFERDNRDYHRQHQRLPSISDHLSVANGYSAASPYGGSGAYNDGPDMQRPSHLRSYSAHVATTQPGFEYPRAITSSGGTVQPDSANFSSTRGYAPEQRPDSSHAYTTGWPQQNYYTSGSAHDHVARSQGDGRRTPPYYGSAIHGATPKRAQHEAVHYGHAWPRADQAVAKAAKDMREE